MGTAGLCSRGRNKVISPDKNKEQKPPVPHVPSESAIFYMKPDIVPFIIQRSVTCDLSSLASIKHTFENEGLSMNVKIRSLYSALLTQSHDISSDITIRVLALGLSGAKHLARILPFYDHITTLSLWKTRLGPEGMAVIANTQLKTLKNLQVLSLEDNLIGPIGAIALAKAIPRLEKLREIWLSVNDIGLEGAKALAGSFSRMMKLEKVNLDENFIESEGAKAIAESLTHLNTPLILSLAFNRLTPSCVDSLIRLIKLCPHLQKINLTGNHIHAEDIARLAGAMGVEESHFTAISA